MWALVSDACGTRAAKGLIGQNLQLKRQENIHRKSPEEPVGGWAGLCCRRQQLGRDGRLHGVWRVSLQVEQLPLAVTQAVAPPQLESLGQAPAQAMAEHFQQRSHLPAAVLG